MGNEFPKPHDEYLKTEVFQDNPTTLTFKEFEYVANEDDPPESKKRDKLTWKQKLKYCLRYSYPKFATDEAGEQILDEDGKPFVNRYYLDQYPRGYTVRYIFDEGTLESGSLPLFKCFCRIRPKAGERLTITRTGKDKETKWSVVRSSRHPEEVPVVNVDEELGPDQEVPF